MVRHLMMRHLMVRHIALRAKTRSGTVDNADAVRPHSVRHTAMPYTSGTPSRKMRPTLRMDLEKHGERVKKILFDTIQSVEDTF